MSSYGPHKRSRHRIFVGSLTLTLAWGTFAFGGVYPWAYGPLMAACGIVGVSGLAIGRRSSGPLDRWFFGALAVILVIGIAQLCPLPQPVLATVSPAVDRFLGSYDLAYASGAAAGALRLEASSSPWHALSIDPAATARALALFGGLILFLAGLITAFSRVSAVRVAKAIVFLGVALALVGIVQKAMLGDQAWDGMKIYGFWRPRYLLVTPFGPYVNKNHYAGWMLMGIPVTLGLLIGMLERHVPLLPPGFRNRLLWLSTPDGGRVLLIAIGVALMSIALLMTASRSGLGCLLVTLIVAGALAKRGFGSKQTRLLVIAGAFLLLIATSAWMGDDAVAKTFGSRPDSVQLRLDIWRDALSIVRASPLVGTGLNTFGTATIVFQSSVPSLHFQEAHNDYLQVLAEGGLLLAVPVMVALFALAIGIRQQFHTPSDDPAVYWVRTGAVVGLIAIGLQSLVEFSLQMPGNAAVFTVLVALALHRPARVRLNHQ